VPYGPDPRQVLDLWKADSTAPAPLVLYVHGGSWMGGSKTQVSGLDDLLAAGISVASVEYRLIGKATAAGVKPPVAWPMHDVARALQFARSKAGEWNVDKTHVCLIGNSAGACTGLWLAFHDDMADPASSDPVARESTRLSCVAGISAQTALDPVLMRAWIPNITYGAHAFGVGPDPAHGLSRFDNFVAQREQLLPWIQEYSPIALVTADDPPVYLSYITAPALGRPDAQPEHSANFGVALERKLRSVGVECVLVHPHAPSTAYPRPQDFVIAKLRPSGQKGSVTHEAPR
jgi:acetyl esterase/lipase